MQASPIAIFWQIIPRNELMIRKSPLVIIIEIDTDAVLVFRISSEFGTYFSRQYIQNLKLLPMFFIGL